MINIEIDARHDPNELTKTFQKTGRLQVRHFLTKESAEALYDMISRNATWFTAYNEGNEYLEIPQATMAKMPPEQKKRFWAKIEQGAREGFQYYFQQYYMTEALENGRETGHPLHQMHHYVNSAAFLDFMRTLTGVSEIDRSDSFASQYLPGHFLTSHDDTHADENRVAAYTISMTRGWRPEWGGNLVFLEEDGNISRGFKPSFNTLNIFRVPQPHAVTCVAPYVGKPRLSYLGWLKQP